MAARFLLVALVAVALCMPSQPAGAQTELDLKSCEAIGGDADEAVAACTRLIRTGKYTGGALGTLYLNRGHHFGRKDDKESAIQDFNEALRIDPRDAQAYTNRGAMFERKKEYARAIADHTRAIELDNNHKDAWYNRGVAYHALGDKQRAIADYRQALRVNPNDDDAKEGLRRLGE